MARGALRGEHRRRVHLVNHKRDTVLGRPTVRSAAEIPGGVELAVVCVPAAGFEDAVDDALGAGARAIVLTNQKAAVLELTGRQVGLLANLDLSGLAITLQ